MALLEVLRQVVARESTRRENIAREEGGGGGEKRLVSYIELAYSTNLHVWPPPASKGPQSIQNTKIFTDKALWVETLVSGGDHF